MPTAATVAVALLAGASAAEVVVVHAAVVVGAQVVGLGDVPVVKVAVGGMMVVVEMGDAIVESIAAVVTSPIKLVRLSSKASVSFVPFEVRPNRNMLIAIFGRSLMHYEAQLN